MGKNRNQVIVRASVVGIVTNLLLAANRRIGSILWDTRRPESS